jgi:hypothetical protein
MTKREASAYIDTLKAGEQPAPTVRLTRRTVLMLMTPISEASFLQQVKALAYLHGWAFHHATPSMTSKGKWITTGAWASPI